MDAIFKALADPTRRDLLDRLRAEGGLTLGALVEGTDLTRFGVMKHLKVLEEASLVAVRRDGRYKRHYLNAAPLQELADRWLSPHVQPVSWMAAALKRQMETPHMSDTFAHQTFIRTTPEKLWAAITDPSQTERYYFGTKVASNWRKGAALQYLKPDGGIMLDGEILEIDPPAKLVATFIPHWGGEPAPASRVTYEIEAAGEGTVKLTILHEELKPGMEGVKEGWAKIAAGLKSLLETGKPLDFAA
ncbi:MAG: metalloregulator ArsR/SmtB family transcription factor [Pseudomonadota bacterium]